MRKLLLAMTLLLLPTVSWSAGGGGYPLDHAPIDVHNEASLQRGAKWFVNYCMGCHSLEYQRWSRFARDAGLSDDQVTDNLIFTGVKVGDTMKNALPKDDSKRWFGAAPPDLSVMARARGADYLYTYLRTFYLDDSRPLGVNNAVFPAVGMPHVMWDQQGWQKPVYETHENDSGEETHTITGFEIVEEGAMKPHEFDAAMADLVNFLVYTAEPAQLDRKRIGFWVLLYLVVAFVVFYLLKKEYWKDVH